MVCLGEIKASDVDRAHYKIIAQEIEDSADHHGEKGSLLKMLLHLSKYEELMFGAYNDYKNQSMIRGLIRLHDRKALWLRDLKDWKPKSKNTLKQFGELAHHLFDEFGDVPDFMNSVWMRKDKHARLFRDWYVHIGQGHNLRKAKSPVPLTKKIVHEFLKAPDEFTVVQALRWGQLKSIGVGDQASYAVVASRLGRELDNDSFWLTYFQFLKDNPMLDSRQVGPIIDYLHHRKFEPTQVEVAPGQWEEGPPEQPGLSLKGRTVDSLLIQVVQWHKELGNSRRLATELYPVPAFSGFEWEKKSDAESTVYKIAFLPNQVELHREGKELKHCVVSYHYSCIKSRCSLWSLYKESHDGLVRKKLITIEVDEDRNIVQCRGRANRLANKNEMDLIEKWASKEGLKINLYVTNY